VRYDGLEYGRKILEFSSKAEAENWKNKNKKIGKIGVFKGKRINTIRKAR
jgi:hypothetical protein